MKFLDIKEGMKLIAVSDWAYCWKKNDKVIVKSDNGRLYIECNEGDHFLDGMIDDENDDIPEFKECS